MVYRYTPFSPIDPYNFLLYYFFFSYGILKHVAKNSISWFIYNSNTYIS